MFDVMMCPVCIVCGKDIVFIIEEHSVTSKCGCKEGFLFIRQWSLLEHQDDELDRSIIINFLGLMDRTSLDQLHYMVKEFREKYLPGIDLSTVSKQSVLKRLREVRGELDDGKL